MPWDFEEVYGALHDFARAYPFQPDREDYLFHITTGTHVQQICLFLLAESRHLPGKLLQTSPPRRKRDCGPGTYRIIDLDLSRYDQLATRFAQEQQEGLSFLKSGIETRNAAVQRADRADRTRRDPQHRAAADHGTDRRRQKSNWRGGSTNSSSNAGSSTGEFVEVNCATLRGDQAMSALFGHAKGAFTGATDGARRVCSAAPTAACCFSTRSANSASTSRRCCCGPSRRSGFCPSVRTRKSSSDFQLIAGTNRDLHADVRAGRFREDLLARINLWTFCLPGLAERREDIAPNLDYELTQFAAQTGQVVRMNKEARERFCSSPNRDEASWTANFRDLNAAVTRMATLAAGGRITSNSSTRRSSDCAPPGRATFGPRSGVPAGERRCQHARSLRSCPAPRGGGSLSGK